MIDEALNKLEQKEPLFASLVRNLKIIEDKKDTPTLGTDGETLYYNPDFFSKLSLEERCAVLLHEVLHCAFLHQWRREKRQKEAWNAACDYAINTVVNESFALPEGALLDMKYYGMSAEEIYNSFPVKKVKGQTWCDKDDWEGQGNNKGKGKSILDKITSKKKKSKTSDAQKEANWNNIFKNNILKNYGQLSDGLKRIIEKSYYMPVLDWTALVSSILSEDINDYTFSQPDRRFLEADYILPAQNSLDRLKDVVFAYDTSGSIGEEDLQAFYMETLNLFNNFSSLQGWIAVCDAWLHSFTEVNPQFGFEDFRFTGFGGTDFNPVFDEIKKRGMKPKALFYFTDCEGDFPQEEPDYPVFWLVRGNIGEQYKPYVPFGTVISFLAN
jgi:predicted metal-dependent peptidase